MWSIQSFYINKYGEKRVLNTHRFSTYGMNEYLKWREYFGNAFGVDIVYLGEIL
jgi:hypothetical protein